LTVPEVAARIAGMFRSKRNKEQAAPPQAAPQAQVSANGYQVTELPTFHGRKRKVVVYTSDAQGKIIKTIKR
jgi:hypothetical protein